MISIIIFGCSNSISDNEKIVKFSDGKSVKINYEIRDIEDNEKVLVVEYKNEEKVTKEKTVENQVLEIWKAVENEANKLEIEEGIIKYEYFAGENKKTKEAVFKPILFSAEKIENGTWKIRKVN